jgi:hypothetical protein
MYCEQQTTLYLCMLVTVTVDHTLVLLLAFCHQSSLLVCIISSSLLRIDVVALYHDIALALPGTKFEVVNLRP